MKREILPDVKKYYYMVLVYADDILCIHKDKLIVIDALACICVMKQLSIGLPDRYLGSNTNKVQTQDGEVRWATHNRDY